MKETLYRITQENSIKNSIQDYLPYIWLPNSLCKLFIAYPKWPHILLKVNMYITHYIMLSLPECSTSFSISHDLSLSLSLCYLIWLMCDQVMSSLTLTLSSQNRKIENKSKSKSKWEQKNKKKLSPLSAILTQRLFVSSM